MNRLPPYWKIATIRCAIYCLVVGANAFSAGVDGYQALSDLTTLQSIKLALNILVSMLGVWIAFLDSTIKTPPIETEPPKP